MSLILSGSDGLSDVDGSAATPAIRGTDANTGIFFPAADTVAISEGGVESARFNSSGNLQLVNSLSVGNATPTTSGAGITFPATQSASSDANTLDDYEEGTFTPTLTSGFSVAPTSYTATTGAYTKIGRVVFFQINLDANGATANASQIKFGGLPFGSAASPNGLGVGCLSYQANFNTTATDTYHITVGSITIDVYKVDGTARNGNDAGVNINNQIVLVGYYQTS